MSIKSVRRYQFLYIRLCRISNENNFLSDMVTLSFRIYVLNDLNDLNVFHEIVLERKTCKQNARQADATWLSVTIAVCNYFLCSTIFITVFAIIFINFIKVIDLFCILNKLNGLMHISYSIKLISGKNIRQPKMGKCQESGCTCKGYVRCRCAFCEHYRMFGENECKCHHKPEKHY